MDVIFDEETESQQCEENNIQDERYHLSIFLKTTVSNTTWMLMMLKSTRLRINVIISAWSKTPMSEWASEMNI